MHLKIAILLIKYNIERYTFSNPVEIDSETFNNSILTLGLIRLQMISVNHNKET